MGDFPGSPVVETLPSSAGGAGSVPDVGAKIPHTSGPKNQNVNNRSNKFNTDFKKIFFIKIYLKKKLTVSQRGL